MSAEIVHSFWIGSDLFYWKSSSGYYYLTNCYRTRRISYRAYFEAFSNS